MAGPSKWRAAPLVVGIVGIGMTIALTVGAVQHRKDTARDWLEERAASLAADTAEAVDAAIAKLDAAAVFLETTPDAEHAEFSEFVSGVGLSRAGIGVVYVAIVPDSGIETYIAHRRTLVPDFQVSEISATGEVVPASLDSPVYYPVQFFEPGPVLELALADTAVAMEHLGIGIDAGSETLWRSGLEQAVASKRATVSLFTDIAAGGTFVGHAFIVAVPVMGADGEPVGLVASPMVDTLLAAAIDHGAGDVEWSIADEPLEPATTRDQVVMAVDAHGTDWTLVVEPTELGRGVVSGLPVWVLTLVGLGATAALAMLANLAASRRTSRRRLAALTKLGVEKDRFLATVSHEIRTPLTAVMAVANELRDRPEDFNPEEAGALLDLMVEQSDEVAALVEDLLIVGRSDVAEVPIEIEVMSLQDAAASAITSSGVPATIVGDDVSAVGDAKRVRQILRNLLTNAKRYGRPPIGVVLTADGAQVAVHVTDNGDPIPQAQQERMFHAYTSTYGSDLSVGSMGLGLFVSFHLARRLGGDLAYHHDGVRSVFTLRLPSAHNVAPIHARANAGSTRQVPRATGAE